MKKSDTIFPILLNISQSSFIFFSFIDLSFLLFCSLAFSFFACLLASHRPVHRRLPVKVRHFRLRMRVQMCLLQSVVACFSWLGVQQLLEDHWQYHEKSMSQLLPSPLRKDG